MEATVPKPTLPVADPVVEAKPTDTTPKKGANDNHPRPANDNLPKENTRGKVRTRPRRLPVRRGNPLVEGLWYAGRILFDPNVFGDHNAYFADTVTRDDYEAELVKQGTTDIKEHGDDPGEVRARVAREIEQHRKEKAAKDPKAESKSEENVKVEEDPCKMGPYKDQKCPPGYQAHHVVPDSAMRYGTRADSGARIPGMPALDDGPAICLKGSAFEKGTEHQRMHETVDASIAEAGDEFGLAKLKDVLARVKKETVKRKKECKEQIEKAVDDAFKSADQDTLVRTTKQPLKPK